MNINVSIRIKRKLIETLSWYTFKLPIYLLQTIEDYKTWHQIKVDALYFDQND